jgi:sugar phosphate permease
MTSPSCLRGYANLICAHIFKSNSAMYVGGVLQMLFGVLGARWLKETPDAVRLYLNEHWSRPKESERPRDYKILKTGATSNNKIQLIIFLHNTIQYNLIY